MSFSYSKKKFKQKLSDTYPEKAIFQTKFFLYLSEKRIFYYEKNPIDYIYLKKLPILDVYYAVQNTS